VGRGGKDNDALSLKVARGNDLWLHAHNWAGAHVVVRLRRDQEVPEQLLLDAATLAAFYSKGRNDTVIEVTYTRAKNVRKPKGLPPGRVTVAGGKTLALRIEPARLQRLLGREADASGV
jgi:predicted ribosome quality control (RQC) complex YloA/Tae2 family protein